MSSKSQRNGGETDGTSLRVSERTAVVLALMTFLSIIAPVGAAAPGEKVTVTQTASSTTVAPGGTVTLEVTIDGRDLNAPAVAVTLPAEWSIIGQSATGPAAYKPSTNEWVWLKGGKYTVQYTVQVPGRAGAGDYQVRAEGSGIVPATDERATAVTRTTLTVEASRQDDTASTGTTATRGNSQTSAAPVTTEDAGTSHVSTAERAQSGASESPVTETVLAGGEQAETTAVSTRSGATQGATVSQSDTAPVAEDNADTVGGTTRASDESATGSIPGFGATLTLVALVLAALFGRR